MKKSRILILIFSFVLVLSLFSIKIGAKTNDLIVLEKVDVEIYGSDKSDIKVAFETKDELLNLEMSITYYQGDQKVTHQIYSLLQATGDTCEIVKNGEFHNNMYEYEFILKSYAKISTFGITFKYVVESDIHEQYLAITNGNPNISRNIFTIPNAITIGLIVSIVAAFGTYIIVKSSESNVQIEEEDVEVERNKGDNGE